MFQFKTRLTSSVYIFKGYRRHLLFFFSPWFTFWRHFGINVHLSLVKRLLNDILFHGFHLQKMMLVMWDLIMFICWAENWHWRLPDKIASSDVNWVRTDCQNDYTAILNMLCMSDYHVLYNCQKDLASCEWICGIYRCTQETYPSESKFKWHDNLKVVVQLWYNILSLQYNIHNTQCM